eukprot:2937884-Pyramimonas_sp.AAC.1
MYCLHPATPLLWYLRPAAECRMHVEPFDWGPCRAMVGDREPRRPSFWRAAAGSGTDRHPKVAS